MSDLEILGAQFRRAREDRRLTFDQIERQTRIRAHYLEAIELGNFGVIPSPVQLRGFVRNYARAVGLDPDLMLAQVEEALANPAGRKPRKTPKTTTTTTPIENASATPTDTLEKYRAPVIVPRASHSSMEVAAAPTYSAPHKRGPMRTVFAVVVATVLTGVIIGGLLVAMNDLAEKSTEATQPSPLLELNPNNPTVAIATGTPTLSVFIPPPNETLDLSQAGNLTIEITPLQRAWVRIVTDGTTVFEGIITPRSSTSTGDFLTYSANDSLTLKTTNAGGLEVKINKQVFRLGEPRQAFEQTFTLEGLITPTFAPTSTPTITYTPSATYTLGASITPTLTETPTLEGNISAPVSPSNTTALLASPGVVSPTPLPPVGGDSSTPTTQSLATTLPAPTAILSPTPLVFNSPTYTPSRTPTNTLPPSSTPNITMTPSPFLPERATRTPTK
ncbi:MAG: DUF4115 domain-containing protein [Chloroflexi bacterium]|nr:DUF4115 domain-containing protein [Chloroflexota bacterium]